MKRLLSFLLAVALCALLAFPSLSRPLVVALPPPAAPTAVTPSTPITVTYDGSGRATATFQFFVQASGTPRLPFLGWIRNGGPSSNWFVRSPDRWGPVRTVTVSQIFSGTPYATETYYLHLTDAGLSFDPVLSINRL